MTDLYASSAFRTEGYEITFKHYIFMSGCSSLLLKLIRKDSYLEQEMPP